jgi:hypothetical protein
MFSGTRAPKKKIHNGNFILLANTLLKKIQAGKFKRW